MADEEYRNLLRRWRTSPLDRQNRIALDRIIEKAGLGIPVRQAEIISAVAQEILVHFGTPAQPTPYYLGLITRSDAVTRNLWQAILEPAIQIAAHLRDIAPGENVEPQAVDMMTLPIFIVMSDLGDRGAQRRRLTTCAFCGRHAPGGLCGGPACLQQADEAMARHYEEGPVVYRAPNDLRQYHAYPENLILFGDTALMYSVAHGVPLNQGATPRRIQNLNSNNRDWSVWCYRLFDPQTYNYAVELSGCHGDGTRANRHGCRQHRMLCICKDTLCSGCYHCRGCGYHGTQCVCDQYYVSSVGQAYGGEVGVEQHPLGYLCGCYGSGWVTTDYDSVHRCALHRIASHHPECSNVMDAAMSNLNSELPDVSECCDLPPSPRAASNYPPTEPEEDLPF